MKQILEAVDPFKFHVTKDSLWMGFGVDW